MLAREFDIFGGKGCIDSAAEWINWETNRIGMCIPQLLWANEHPQDVPEGARLWLRRRLEIDTSRLDRALHGTKFLLGTEPTIADLCVFGYVSKAQDPENGIASFEFPPAILDWISRIQALPRFQTPQDLLGSSQNKN